MENLVSGNNFSSAEALFLEGNRHMAAADARQAEACFREAIRLEPECAELHANLALLLEQEGKLSVAEQLYRHAISLNPNLGRTHLNLGALLTNLKRFAEAEAAYRRSQELMPNSPAVWSNMGVLHACRKEELEAEQCYRRAMRLAPDYRPARFNLSYLLLRQARFEEGWRCLEARDWYAGLERRIPSPRWRGEPLEGRSLLIGFEAGHGDMIQFCRYAAVLKAQGTARITLMCHPALKRVFASLDAVDELITFEEAPSGEWDFWTPPLTIAYYCRTRLDSIPAELPYLRADRSLIATWSAELAGKCDPAVVRVGLVWQGNPDFENDADRSLPSLETLAPLGDLEGICFFSLQKGPGETEAARPPAGLPLLDLGPWISDFADSAAIVMNLDLIICVDTAIAHLAGALGKQCWVLLPEYKTDWRWMTGRADSPWYPGVMRLFRQTRMGDWGTVVAELRTALRHFSAQTFSLKTAYRVEYLSRNMMDRAW